MLQENLKTLRKARGLTQEELAIRLNVVRQTVSKWEKGLSVPDAEMLVKLADILESSVAELLGTKIEEEHPIDPVAEQLSRINEQLAVRNRRARRVWRTVGIVLGAFVLLVVLLVTVAYLSLRTVRVYPGGDQAFPDSEREREALDPAFKEQVGLSRYGERLYQPLAGSRFLLKTDGHLWVAEINGGTIRTVFEIMP